MNRAAVAFLAFILFLAFIGILLAATLGHGHKKPAAKTPVAKVMTLPDYYNTDATTSFTIDGQVNGDETHRAIRITVGQTQREVDIIQGYSGTVISSQTFYNNANAYFVFLTAINNQGFLLARKPTSKMPASPADERGQCPFGDSYILQLSEDGDSLSRLWASDCGLADGTLGVSPSQIQTLFEAQIPQYQTIVQDVNL